MTCAAHPSPPSPQKWLNRYKICALFWSLFYFMKVKPMLFFRLVNLNLLKFLVPEHLKVSIYTYIFPNQIRLTQSCFLRQTSKKLMTVVGHLMSIVLTNRSFLPRRPGWALSRLCPRVKRDMICVDAVVRNSCWSLYEDLALDRKFDCS